MASWRYLLQKFGPQTVVSTIDVAVIYPVAASHVHEEEPCENYVRLHKHARYEAGFQGSDYD